MPSPIIARLGALSQVLHRSREAVSYFSTSRPRDAITADLLRAERARVATYTAKVDAARVELRSTVDNGTTCGARCRDGHACRAPRVPGRRRCRMHGGLSTGPRTPEGMARALEALRRPRPLPQQHAEPQRADAA